MVGGFADDGLRFVHEVGPLAPVKGDRASGLKMRKARLRGSSPRTIRTVSSQREGEPESPFSLVMTLLKGLLVSSSDRVPPLKRHLDLPVQRKTWLPHTK